MSNIDRDGQIVFRSISVSEEVLSESLEFSFGLVNASVDECKEDLNDIIGRVNKQLSAKKISQKLVTIVIGVLLFQTSLLYILFQLMPN